MGITIAYRGRITDLARIEDFEDRLVDCALAMGGQVRIWRTWADDNPERMVRGAILDLVPGQDSTSLLFAPEGWLINLTEIQDAEEGRLQEPPWCFVKTQFGPVEGHVALVEILAALKREFLPDLEVSDEGGYWETRDPAALVRRRSLLKQAIDGLAEGLRRHGLSREAAEDPGILLRHIARVAEQVHRTLHRPAEHPPVETQEEGDIPPPLDESRGDEPAGETPSLCQSDDHAFRFDEKERHPLLQKAMDLLVRFDAHFRNMDPQLAPALGTLYRGAGDAMGGLAQALLGRDDDAGNRGLRVIQLKRALRGAAFARGALFPLRPTLGAEQFDELYRTLEEIETETVSELGRVRCESEGDDV
jgi:hypothetical protein